MELNLRYIRALTKLAGKDASRSNLCGVLIERKGADLYYAATNGHVLGVFHETVTEAGPDFSIIIPRATAEKCAGLASLGRSEFSVQGAECRIENTKHGVLVFVPLDKRFPDFWRVLPDKIKPGEQAQFNPRYLAAFVDCLNIAYDKKGSMINLQPNGDKAAAVVSSESDFFGCIMPWRTGIISLVPAWAAGKVGR